MVWQMCGALLPAFCIGVRHLSHAPVSFRYSRKEAP